MGVCWGGIERCTAPARGQRLWASHNVNRQRGKMNSVAISSLGSWRKMHYSCSESDFRWITQIKQRLMSTTCWGSLFVTLGELPSNFTGCSSALLRCFSFAPGKIHCCSRNKKGSCHSSSSFPLSSNARFEGRYCSLRGKELIYFAASFPAPSCPPLFNQGVPASWVVVSGLALGWL